MTRNSDLSSRLKQYRESRSLTLADLERLTGVPAQTLNRYELGQRAPKIDVAVCIAQALDINPLWLQGFDVPLRLPREEEAYGGLMAADGGMGGAQMEDNAAAIDLAVMSADARRVGLAYDAATPKIQNIVRVTLDLPDGEG